MKIKGKFAAFHRYDTSFYLGFVAFCWIAIGFGFGPGIWARFQGLAPYEAPLALQIHVFSYIGWMVLLTMQMLLVRFKVVNWHKKLGLASIILIPIMFISGALAEIYAERYYGTKTPGEETFLIFNIYALPAFVILSGWAVLARKQAAIHKRLMLLATSIIMAAAFNRWFWDILVPLFDGHPLGIAFNVFVGSNLLIAALLIYDLLTRKRLHPIYTKTVPSIVLAQATSAYIYTLPAWAKFVRPLLGLS
jgi:hypothetical protein